MLREVKFHNAIKLSTARVTNSIKMAVINIIGFFSTFYLIPHSTYLTKKMKISSKSVHNLKMTVLVVNINISCKVSFERDLILERIY